MTKKHGSGRHHDPAREDDGRAKDGGDSASTDARESDRVSQDLDVAEGFETPPQAELGELRRERDEYLASWQRSQADYQNLRRRLQSDIDAAVQRAQVPLVQDLLLVMDYLEMALATPCATQDCKNVLQGIELTKSVLTRALDRVKVRPVADADTFDSSLHQAVERVETAEREPGSVLATLRRGYTQDGQVLRPAQVKVAVAPTTDAAARDEDQRSTTEGEAS